jgi:lysophospholipase L1-like esterase
MKRLNTNLILLSVIVLFFINWNSQKPRILIIGDSISIGYTPFVQEYLSDIAYVHHNPGNAQHTGTGLARIEEWLGSANWDIIQFNWGLWDLCYRHPDSKVQGNRDKINGKITYSIDDYASNLDSIVSVLKNKSRAKLIFVTTTYVPEQESGRFTQDAIRYNDIAKQIMKKHSVTIHDIYKKSVAIHNKHGKGANDVHYTQEGYRQLGKGIANFLEEEIRNLNDKKK